MFQERLSEHALIKFCSYFGLGFKSFISNEDGSYNLNCILDDGKKVVMHTTDFTCVVVSSIWENQDYSAIWTNFITSFILEKYGKEKLQEYHKALYDYSKNSINTL